MADGGREHDVLWHCALLASSEHASLVEHESGHRFHGFVVLPLEGVPCHIAYDVVVDRHWESRAATATVTTPSSVRRMALTSDLRGHWQLDGHPAHDLDGCTDVDLGWTPATNTVPIRRLGLAVGESAEITAAWVRFPELDVLAAEQEYTRLAADRWRYRSGDFERELVTDATTGLVLAYGDDLWQAVATTF
jgi:uncharacterized protein